MTIPPPAWTRWLLRRLAPPDRVDDVLGDLEEAHLRRIQRHSRFSAQLLTCLDVLDMSAALLRQRRSIRRTPIVPRFSLLDFKLGIRMLLRYPGLTLVGGLAMAFAIWVSAGTFELARQFANPSLPLEDGDRIVGLRLWDTSLRRVEERALHDFVSWREDLSSVEDLSAFRTLERNLIIGAGTGEPVQVAEINAGAFRVARVRALHGRVLDEGDELASAPAVVVIGFDVWQKRFGGDPDVIGHTVRLGNVQPTVIGVMPKDFAFPVSHELWVPLRLNVLDYARRDGPSITMLGRLTAGVSLNEAKAELSNLGERAAIDFRDTHEHLRPQVVPYAASFIEPGDVSAALSINGFVVMLLVLVSGNVALLMFARAATRESEIVVRSALGASRGRIITQLFAEALVLGGLGAAVGLAATRYGLRWGLFVLELNLGRLPFWFDDAISRATLLYACVLTVVGAAIAGVVPALRVTRAVGNRLRQASAGGGGLEFSGLWTVVIVMQVATTVAFPVSVFFLQRVSGIVRSFDAGFAAEEFLSVRLEMDSEDAARLRRVYRELERRLSAESAVEGVTFASRLPRMFHPEQRIDVIESTATHADSILGVQVRSAYVDIDYFDVLGAPVLYGRGFHAVDIESAHRVVIVNQSFVERVLGGRNPIGQRLRFTNGDDPSYEIIGVARDLGLNYLGRTSGNAGAGVYQPLAPRSTQPVYMAVKVKGNPESFGPRLQALASELDPSLRLYKLQRLDRHYEGALAMFEIYLRITLLVSAVALLLSLAGIYSVMSFTVSRRTREIGIRVALGSDPLRIVLTIFRRPLAQITMGIIAGGGLTALLAFRVAGSGLTFTNVAFVVAYSALMLCVCMLACIVPTRRALRIQPTDALREDG